MNEHWPSNEPDISISKPEAVATNPPRMMPEEGIIEARAFVSVVIPCYNEAEVLPLLCQRLLKLFHGLGSEWEAIFVDDGSTDATAEKIRRAHNDEPRFKLISLSRNFGHQAAITAGLHFARGNVIAVMDADLQDPPEILVTALDLLGTGYDIVYAVRRKRKEHLLKRVAYRLFYRFLNLLSEVDIPLDSGDFCAMNRSVVEALKNLPERNLFVRGLRAWVGFRQIGLEYERHGRAAGTAKYDFRKLVRLAADGIFSFSTIPLKLAIYLGFATLLFSFCAGLFILAWRLFGFEFMGHTARELPGWSAVMGIVIVFNGVQLFILGLVGDYIGRIYKEVKQRPRWIIRDSLGITAEVPTSGSH